MSRCIWLAVAGSLIGGCQDLEVEDTGVNGYVLFGAEARYAGAKLADDTPVGVLPVALPAETPALVFRTAVVPISTGPEVLTYAFGGGGERDTLLLGTDVFDDRIAVDGTAQGIQRLAEQLGSEMTPADDGRWILTIADAWALAADVAAAPGITEVFPVDIAADGTAAVRARFVPPAAPTVAAEPSALPHIPGMAAAAELAATSAPKPEPAQPCTAALGCTTRCADPIAGVWLGRTYRSEFGDWFEFTLSIARTGSRLRGTIQARYWAGEPDDPRPTLCFDDDEPAVNIVEMQGAGTWSDTGVVKFASQRIDRVTAECGGDSEELRAIYALDNFTGKLASDRVLRAGNTDGAAAFDRKYNFKRVSCGK
jgi:hypothetical protein